ncbi:acyl-CoA carboxylase epsilon subunit [Actinotalea solisilvae]|uniref:acyl-CoA carboxylase epsilon subunit n=1 Tax=Actinotalea solisilvae TaxID=2072922 RepID=UPI0018F26419|nr:acyl-CoA carboxylase epsilon subunit [Actinotalea solisilvae]
MTPDVRVVRGEPDDVELAALVAGLAASAADEDPGPGPTAASRAGDAARRWRAAAWPSPGRLAPGADAWRWSSRA